MSRTPRAKAADAVAALPLAATWPDIETAIRKAQRREEPTTLGAIVILYRSTDPWGSDRMLLPGVILQFQPGCSMDTEENGFARWWDSDTDAYRTWDWICERDSELRIFVPETAMSMPSAWRHSEQCEDGDPGPHLAGTCCRCACNRCNDSDGECRCPECKEIEHGHRSREVTV